MDINYNKLMLRDFFRARPLNKAQNAKGESWSLGNLPKYTYIIPVVVFAIGACISYYSYNTLHNKENNYIKDQVEDEVGDASALLEAQINQELLSLKRMAQRWEVAGRTPVNLWQADAANYVNQLQGLKTLEWVDPTYHVQWVEPLIGNESVVGLNVLFDQKRADTLKDAATKQTPTLSPPLNLVQGYKGFIAYIPLYVAGNFDGFIAGVFSVNDFFSDTLIKQLDNKFLFSVSYGGIEYSKSKDQPVVVNSKWAIEKPMKLQDQTWSLRLVPTDNFIRSQESKFPLIVLLAGLLISGLAAFVVRSILISRLKSRYLEQFNHEISKKNEALIESEMRHQQLVDGVQDYAIYWLDPNGNIESWNSGAERFKGYTREEIIGQNFSKFYTEEDQRNGLPQTALRLATIHGKYEDEGWRVRKNGSKFWANVSISPIRDLSGELTGFAKVTKDITERQKFEEHLIRSEERYNLAVDGMSVGVWDWDVVTGEMYWSPRLKEIFGVNDVSFKPDLNYFSDHLHPDDKEQTLKKLSEHLDRRGPYNVEYRFMHPDGRYVWIHASGQAKWDANGKALRMAGSVDDITPNKLASRALADAYMLQSAILSSASYLIIATNKNGTVVNFNKAAEDKLGYSAAEIVNKQTPALWHDTAEITAHAQTLTQELGKEIVPGFEVFTAKADLGMVASTEWTFICSDGSRFPGRLTATAIRNADNEITGYLGIIEDITESKKIDRLKSEFISIVSHELRTPMSGVIGMNDLLLYTNLDEQQRHYSEMINYSAEALLQILDDILDVSKIEAGKMGLEIIPFDLRKLCDGIMELEQIRAQKKNIQFTLNYAADCPDKLWGDPVRIRQILFNLCNNAVKFTENGRVTLNITARHVTEESADIIFAVTDSGIGISPEKHEVIFNKFDQADATITRRFGGTGLGLPISRQLARLMGGDITLQSSPGNGSVFTMLLTLKRADEITTTVKLQNIVRFENARVLVAEDNIVNQEVLSAVLERHGIQSIIANNGKEAVELLSRHLVDLVLMDCQMPEMDGFEATRAIRANTAFLSLPIVAMTANAMKSDREKCIAAGMDDFLSKPVKKEKLSEILLRYLSVKQKRVQA